MRLKSIVLVLLLFVFAGTASAGGIDYTDLGTDHLWTNVDNWSLGVLPDLVTNQWVNMKTDGTIAIVSDGMDAYGKGVYPGCYGGDNLLQITGGTLTGSFLNAGRGGNNPAHDGSYGVIEMSGGVCNFQNVEVPNQFNGTYMTVVEGILNMSDGAINLTAGMNIGKATGSGVVTLTGGVIDMVGGVGINLEVNTYQGTGGFLDMSGDAQMLVGVDNLESYFTLHTGVAGTVTIGGNARLVVGGNHVAEFEQYITDGWLVNNTGHSVKFDGASTIIPEPATLILLGLGGLILRRKR